MAVPDWWEGITGIHVSTLADGVRAGDGEVRYYCPRCGVHAFFVNEKKHTWSCLSGYCKGRERHDGSCQKLRGGYISDDGILYDAKPEYPLSDLSWMPDMPLSKRTLDGFGHLDNIVDRQISTYCGCRRAGRSHAAAWVYVDDVCGPADAVVQDKARKTWFGIAVNDENIRRASEKRKEITSTNCPRKVKELMFVLLSQVVTTGGGVDDYITEKTGNPKVRLAAGLIRQMLEWSGEEFSAAWRHAEKLGLLTRLDDYAPHTMNKIATWRVVLSISHIKRSAVISYVSGDNGVETPQPVVTVVEVVERPPPRPRKRAVTALQTAIATGEMQYRGRACRKCGGNLRWMPTHDCATCFPTLAESWTHKQSEYERQNPVSQGWLNLQAKLDAQEREHERMAANQAAGYL